MDQRNAGLYVTIFFCQQVDSDQDVHRRSLEKEFGGRVKFFPLPCSGRVDQLHLLKALETGADMVYLVTCAEGACRYREGNLRARKRLSYARGLIEEIGLEPSRLELITMGQGKQVTIDALARELLQREPVVGPSPLRARRAER
jgi:F420-non-reducing hydrogenase iron-sulfur subunit